MDLNKFKDEIKLLKNDTQWYVNSLFEENIARFG